MSENLDRVCRLADSDACRFWSAEDLKEARAAIAALRAEFSELERKAEENRMKAEMLDGLVKWLQENDGGRHFGFTSGCILQVLDSLAKGGRDADDVP